MGESESAAPASEHGVAERDPRQAFRLLEVMVLMMAIVFVYLGTYDKSFGDTANSRLATVQSLTKYGTWYIDRPIDEEPIRFEQKTIDKVSVNGHIISSKPPMLPLMMTGEYLVMRSLFGLDLDSEEDTEEIIRYMSMTLIGIPYILTLVFFMLIARMFIEDGMARFVALLGLAFGTQLWGYGTNINNHVPATCLMVIALYFALGLGSGKLAPKAWRFFAFGFIGALMPTVDMPGGIFVFIGGLYILAKFPKQTLTWTIAGMVIPLVVHFGIMYAVTGSLLPVQVRKDLYLYEASYWRNPRGIDALNEPRGEYFFHMMIGRTGLYMLFPITIVGALAFFRSLWPSAFPYRGYILAAAAGFAVLTAYYVKSTNNYGGEAFGFRWYIVAMPIMMLMGLPFLARLRSNWQWTVIAFLLGISFFTAWQCSVNPWGSNREWTVQYFGRSYW